MIKSYLIALPAAALVAFALGGPAAAQDHSGHATTTTGQAAAPETEAMTAYKAAMDICTGPCRRWNTAATAISTSRAA